MPLNLYQSNRLEALGILYHHLTDTPLADPFAPEVVMVQSRGMGRWLTLQLARARGLAANMEFVLPAGFGWRLMKTVLPELPPKSAFAPEVLTWRLMAVLPTLDGEPFTPLTRYLQGGALACHELAGKIADIYDQYLVFRPEWIRAWQAGQRLNLGEDEAWQAALWQRLADSVPGRHRVAMLDDFFAALRREHLPQRVSVFGIATLAPMYLALLKRMAELTEVNVFLLGPSEAYWGDIVDARGQLKLFAHGEQADSGHPLLASLGQQGRDFFDEIAAGIDEPTSYFMAPQGDALLPRLQRDILTLSQPAANAQPLAADDRSIVCHIAHSPMRELEVLKDQLLGLLAADATLTPADIAVLTPDINSYAPYIDAVFGYRADAPSIPYSIADRRIAREVPLLATFGAVLELADSRFVAADVLALLDCQPLLARFGLQDEDVTLLTDWVRNAGIRWGRDAGHKAELGLPAEATHTWRWGLDRLLLGSVLPASLAGDGMPLFGGLLPDSAAQGQMASKLASLAALFEQLDALARLWAQPASIADWAERLRTAAAQLFLVDEDGEAALQLLHQIADELAADAALAGFDGTVPLPVVRDAVLRQLEMSSSGGFLTGGLTFCAMVPMRSIPFRVLCLVGMNDGAYPRDERPVSFDLVARHPKKGDRSRRFDDRYLFLEAILSARDTLYLSWVGRSVRSDEPLPPSPLVAELLDTLAAMSGGDISAAITTRHPLQPFSRRYYDGSLASHEPLWAAALAQPPATPQPFARPLARPEPLLLPLADFLRFWQNPVRAWLADGLGLKLERLADELPGREPFAIDRDSRSQIRDTLVHSMLAGKPLRIAEARLQGQGLLPDAALGEACLTQERAASARFASRLPQSLLADVLPPQPLRLDIGGVTLVGELAGLRPEGLLRVVPRKAYANEYIRLWLEHLLRLAAGLPHIAPESQLFADDGVHRFGPCDKDGQPLPAAELLAAWVARYLQGRQLPLPFFARTSLAYARAESGSELSAAQNEWAPEFTGHGRSPQREEAANLLVFRHQDPLSDPLFAQLAETLLRPLVAALDSRKD
ncbi:exodeoxyribonuclease V subunit gamma [Vogesella oryzae]|uniref:exodeoxyribonuclease V subunit gamma n=1 Tax=Vogesella oryzae TaxID=1735285 RepID=UPI0015814421|nr:exodeoxyribonuclease V subunit gamma [Vogesella oryzae]